MNQLGVTTGIVTALALGIPLSRPTIWRIVPLIAAVLPVLQILSAPMMTESPVWLSNQRRPDFPSQEESSLLPNSETDATDSSLPTHERQHAISIGDVWMTIDPDVRKGMRVVTTTQIAQQRASPRFIPLAPLTFVSVSGINAVMYFSTSILAAVFPTSAQLISLCVALVNCVTVSHLLD
jgi:SP family facilitated glucose transporter-like MFS transporter 3